MKYGTGALLQAEIDSFTLQSGFHGSATNGQESMPSITQSMLLEPGSSDEFIIFTTINQSAVAGSQQLHALKGKDWDAAFAREEIEQIGSLFHIKSDDTDWNEIFHYSQVHALRILNTLDPADTNPRDCQLQRTTPDRLTTSEPVGKLRSPNNLFDLYHGFNIVGNIRSIKFKQLLASYYVDHQIDGQEVQCIESSSYQTQEGMAFPTGMAMIHQIYLQTADLDWLRSIYDQAKISLVAWFSTKNDKDQDGCPEWSHPYQAGLDESILLNQFPLLLHPYLLQKMENPGLLHLIYCEQCVAARIAEILDYQEDAMEWQIQAKISAQHLDDFWHGKQKTYQVLDFEAHHNHPQLHIKNGWGNANLAYAKRLPRRSRLQITISLNDSYTRPIRILFKGQLNLEYQEETINFAGLIWQKGLAVGISKCLFDQIDAIQLHGLKPDETWTLQTLHIPYQDISMLLPLLNMQGRRNQKRILDQKSILERWGHRYGIPSILTKSNDGPAYYIASVPWNSLMIENMLNSGHLSSAADLFRRIMDLAEHQLRQNSCLFSYYDSKMGNGFGEKDTLRGLIPVMLFLRLLGLQKITQDEIIITHFNPFTDWFTVQYKGIKLTFFATSVEISCRGFVEIITKPGTYRICFTMNVVK